MNILDRLVSMISPRAGAERQFWRMRGRAFEAAKDSIYHRRPKAQGSADSSMEKAREKIRDWARHLDENHDAAIAILDELVNKIVGAGIGCEPLVLDRNGNPIDSVNDQLYSLWEKFSDEPEVTGELPLSEMCRLACRTWLRDGEILGQHVLGRKPGLSPRHGIPYAVELIESDYLPFDLSDQASNIIHGIQKNAWQRPTVYHLLKQHPNTEPFVFIRVKTEDTRPIPADRIIHLKFTRRINQTRGVSVFHGVAHRLDDIKDYEESERIAARIGASFSAYIKKGTDFDPTKGYDSSGNYASSHREMQLAAGMIFDDLLPGEEVSTIDTNRPNTALPDFIQHNQRMLAGGTGTAPSGISKNFHQGTYSSQRQELVESYPGYDRMRDYFTAIFLAPMRRHFIDACTLTGRLKLPRAVDMESLYACEWLAPPRAWIDPLKEIKADREAIDGEILPVADIIRKRTGKNPRIVQKQIDRERKQREARKPAEPINSPEPEAGAGNTPPQRNEVSAA